MSENTSKSENLHRIRVILVLNVNLIICFILIKDSFGIEILFFDCNNEIRGIYACFESFILIMAIIATIKKSPYMILCTIIILLGELFIYLCLSICTFYRHFFGILWQILADQSTENVNEEEVLRYMYILIVLFFVSIYFTFKYYSLKVLLEYEANSNKINRSTLGQKRCDIKYVSGLVENANGPLDAPPPYDFHGIESAMSGCGNGII